MTIYMKWVLGWMGFYAGFMITTILAMDVSQYFLIAGLANFLGWQHYLRNMVCPNCATPIHQTSDDFYQRPRILRTPVGIFKSKCHVCRVDLTKSY